MPFLTVLIIAAAAEFFLVPLYVKKCWPEKNKTSLLIKMICSTLFVTAAVCAMLYSGNKSTFAYIMLGGFCLSWVGDFFLHVNSKKSSFIIGFSSFFFAHILYTTAYCVYMAEKGESFFNLWQAVALAVIYAIALLVAHFSNLRLGKIRVPAMVYAFVLGLMFIKAVSLGVLLSADGFSVGLVTLSAGALSFVLSDASLIYIYFGDKKSFGFKFFNSATYFAAQILLAVSILFVK